MSAAAVDSATTQMANTSLNSSSTAPSASVGTGGAKPINASHNDAVIQSAAEGRRLYIGNLAYATTEGELKEFFKDYLVETTSIPVNPRTTKPVGYAFVDLATSSEAERAVNELNDKTILERKVSVQLARKPDEAVPAENGDVLDGEARRPSGRGRGRGRGGRTARGGRAQGARNGENDGSTAQDSTPTNLPGQVLPLTEAPNETSTTKDGEADTTSGQAKLRQPRQTRNRGPPEDGVPSKTKIMVANLPYDLREDRLLEIFKDYSPTTAKLALRPIPRFMVRKLQARNEERKGRGFAFVTLASEELQQKAIKDMNGKEIEGRELAVKVAIDSPGKEDDKIDGAKENGVPPTTKGAATTSAAIASS